MPCCTKVSLVLVVLIVQLRGANGDCPEAVSKSVVKVQSCPTSKEERDRAASIKNCNKTAIQNKCSNDLRYHCVINGFRNETLEVCATRRLMHGYCTEFNVAGRVIQSHSLAPCNKMTFPECDTPYFSTEAYKYPGCYELVNNYGRNTTLDETNGQRNTTIEESNNRKNATSDQPEKRDTTPIIAAAILGTLFIVVLVVGIGVFIYKRRKKNRWQNDITANKGEIATLIQETHELEEGSPEKTEDNMNDENRERKIPTGFATKAKTTKDTSAMEGERKSKLFAMDGFYGIRPHSLVL